MIKNEFQKIYKKIISQAPIFDTFDDQVIKPKLVKQNNDYYFHKMKDFEDIDLDKVVNSIYENESDLLYSYINPFQIYNKGASQDFNLFKIKSYTMDKYDTINEYEYYESGVNIALQFSIIHLKDISPFKSNEFRQDSFVTKRFLQYAENEEDIADIIKEKIYEYDVNINAQHEEESEEEYFCDITKGCILFVYFIIDLATDKTLFIDHDIFENTKFLTGMIPPTIDYLKAKIKKYFKQKKVFAKIEDVLTNKLIEIKNNY